ncbi:MAG: formate dehydrogenase subunit delta [Pseudomonadota bacterium]|nr:formate dehydrogenase subunit delta [Pseudomonadota bacterium]
MANQIGDAFIAQAPEQAAQNAATHVRKFWTPKMIAQTLAALDSQQIRLNETAAAGFAILRKEFAAAE